MQEGLGRHLLVEFWDCGEGIDDEAVVRRAVTEAVEAARALLLNLQSHAFQPMGVTALALLSESHLAVHTWPERRYAAADLFTCGEHVDPSAAVDVLARHFEAAHVDVEEVARGRRPAARGTPSSAIVEQP